MMWIMFLVVSIWFHLNQKIWTVILHKWNKLELTYMNCSWVAELEQKQIFLPFYIPFKIFCLGLPAIHVYEIRFYLPTVLPCSRCDSHESMFSNLELAAAGSPSKLLHSQHRNHNATLFLFRSEQQHGMLVLIFLLMVNGNNNILLMLYYYYIK